MLTKPLFDICCEADLVPAWIKLWLKLHYVHKASPINLDFILDLVCASTLEK